MKLAIHHRPGSFSDRWIAYCKKENISYKIVNCYNNDIVDQVKECEVLLWHHSHGNYKDVLTAKRILFALEHSGIKVFPNFNTAWHFDDKVAQKYLLEAINAPLVPSYVFYDKEEALTWANQTTFPKVFKLKGGAGSQNVKLVNRKKEAIKLINQSFGKGFPLIDKWNYFKELKYKNQTISKKITNYLRGLKRGFFPTNNTKTLQNEKGYAYFQEFIPNNDSDTRVIVIGEKAFAVKRMTRNNDFRASGSGVKKYNKEEIDERCIEISFNVNKKIQSQSFAVDFVSDTQKNPLIVEISYGFSIEFYDPCPGYWTEDLQFHEGKFIPQEWMVENVIHEAKTL